MKTWLLTFSLLFVALFAGLACHGGSGFATGANFFAHYGWPSAWLEIHRYRTHSVVVYSDHRVTEDINRLEGVTVTDWSSCFVSASIAATFSAITATVLPNMALQRTAFGRRWACRRQALHI